MADNPQKVAPPAIPYATAEYSRISEEESNKALRLFFNRLANTINAMLNTDNGGAFSYIPYGEFCSTDNQNALVIDTPYAITYNTTTINNAVTLEDNSEIHTSVGGIYSFQLALQLDEHASKEVEVIVWAKKNGTNIANSAHRTTVKKKADLTVTLLSEMEPDDYIEFWWQTEDTDAHIHPDPASGGYPASSSASVIVTYISNK